MLILSRVTILIFLLVLVSSFGCFVAAADIDMVEPEFAKMDADNNGFVTPGEMQSYQEQRFRQLDKDNNGLLDQDELAADTTKMFSAADKDKDSKVTREEAKAQFNEYFKQMDKNNDNKINKAEYTDYWKGTINF